LFLLKLKFNARCNERIIMSRIISLLVCALFIATPAHAGLLDKLNQATQKLNDYNAKKQGGQTATGANGNNGTDEDHPVKLEGQGHCKGNNTATCMDYMEVAGQCMEPLNGYRMKVTADVIEKKLKTEKLTDAQRKDLETDLVGIKEAYKNKTDHPTINGQKNSQRYLDHISEEDQVYINAEYGKFHKKIYNKCMGADHMGIGKRTEMMAGVETMSGEDAVKQHKAKKAKEEESFNCLKNVSGVRYTVMADMMEKKMQTTKLSGAERAEWEADIVALREAAELGGTIMPKSPDPSNPYRAMMHLTSNEDMMALSSETSKKSQAMIQDCEKKGPQRPKQKLTGTTSEILAAKKVQGKKDAENEAIYQKNKAKGTGGGSLSASLGATDLRYLKTANKCLEPMQGHMAKVTADMLEKRLGQAKGVSAEKRKMWQEDIAAWRAAEQAGADQPDPPDADKPYRWQDYITKGDRQKINMEHSKFVTELTTKCNAVDHMGLGMKNTTSEN